MKKILIIQFKPFGDVFLSTSYLESLKCHFENSEITYLTGKDFIDAVQSHPLVDKIISVRFYSGFLLYFNCVILLFKIRIGRFNLVIDQQNSTVSRLLTILSGAKIRAGWHGRKWESHLNCVAHQPEGNHYAAERNLEIARAIGVKNVAISMLFTISNDSRNFVTSFLSKNDIKKKQFVTIAPGSKGLTKQWHTDGWINLCNLIIQKYDSPVVILYAPYEYATAMQVADSISSKAFLSPETNINQAIAFIDESMVFICNDCALNHISTATTAPSIGIFGSSSAQLWSPALAFSKHRHLCNNQWIKDSSNDFGITPHQVLECLDELLDTIHSSH